MAIKSNHAEEPFCFCTNSNFFVQKIKKRADVLWGLKCTPKVFCLTFGGHFITSSVHHKRSWEE